ncbi:MAG: site-specific integrase [Fermentimonas sp.]|jgi:site-specific recombinase XerD|uniref:site-specific integrase n=1 Tax=Porphyromonas pogonae TaxID=867595 RepID=UPI001776101F|nr:site-specific integrase [Porphyromonas pogonae]HHU97713.1 site-specific integrase [Petrimonas sp.]
MKTIFRTVFYLRSNYTNKEGLSPVMIRIYLNNQRLSIGSSGVAINPKSWDNEKNRLKGRSTEILQANLQLDNIQAGLQAIFRRLELSEDLSLELIKSEFLGKKEQLDTILSLFEKHNNDIRNQVGISKSVATLQKYENCKRHFSNFIKSKYGRTDLKLSEVTPIVIHDFRIYLLTTKKCMPNTTTKILKFFKTIILFGRKNGFLTHDPFREIRFHLEPVDRGFLTDNEIKTIMQKEMVTPRLELVRDMFIFSCFTGLAYIDVANLTEDNIVELDGKQWIMTKRQKTKIATNIILLDIPKMIIEKYASVRKDGKLLPILSNQKMNAYLKEIADICQINKNLTYHVARHTFATMSISKGVPIETVSKMLGHSKIQTTQIYARITNKKLEADMLALSSKLDKFTDSMNINP